MEARNGGDPLISGAVCSEPVSGGLWPGPRGTRPPGQGLYQQPALFFLLSLAGHIGIIVPLAVWASRQPPSALFELAPGSPFLEVSLVDLARLGGGGLEAPEPYYLEAENPAVEDISPEIEETPPAEPEPPEPEPPQPFDLKPPEPEEALGLEPRPETETPKPRKPAKATGTKRTPGPPGPGQELGSPQGNADFGGGGAGGTGISGAAGWQAVRVPQPLYPPASRQNGEQGRVVVAVIVSPAGLITSASIVRSSGYPGLDQAALNAARHISFRAKSGGAPPAAVTVQVPYRFRLI